MALAVVDFLAAIEAARSTDAGCLDRLAVDDADAEMGVAPHLDPQALSGIELFPQPREPPRAEVMIDGLPGRQVTGQAVVCTLCEKPAMTLSICSTSIRRHNGHARWMH